MSPVPPAPWREPTVIDSFEPDGTWVGRIAVPHGTTILTLKDNMAWGSTTDEDDVQSVRRFRIVWR